MLGKEQTYGMTYAPTYHTVGIRTFSTLSFIVRSFIVILFYVADSNLKSSLAYNNLKNVCFKMTERDTNNYPLDMNKKKTPAKIRCFFPLIQ